jgi:hypothetical protein
VDEYIRAASLHGDETLARLGVELRHPGKLGARR